MLPTFVFATGVLLANGMIPFGVSSLLFIAMAFVQGRYWGSKREGALAPAGA